MKRLIIILSLLTIIFILSCDSRNFRQFVQVRGTVDGNPTDFDLYYRPGGQEVFNYVPDIPGTYEIEVYDEGYINLRANKVGFIVTPPETVIHIDMSREIYEANFTFVDTDRGYIRISGYVDDVATPFTCIVEHPTATDTIPITTGFTDYTIPETGLFRFTPYKFGHEAMPQRAELNISILTDVRSVSFDFADTMATDDTTGYYIFAKGRTDEADVSFSLVYTGPESDSVFIPVGGKSVELSSPGEYRVHATKGSFIADPAETTIYLSNDNPGDTLDFLFADTSSSEIEIFIKGYLDGDDQSFICRIERDAPPLDLSAVVGVDGYTYTSTEYGHYTVTPLEDDLSFTPDYTELDMSESNPADTAEFEFSGGSVEYWLAISGRASGSATSFNVKYSTDTLAGWSTASVSGHTRLEFDGPTRVFVRADKDIHTSSPSLYIANLTADSPDDSVHFTFTPVPDYESEIYFADLSGGRICYVEDFAGTGFTAFDGEGFFAFTEISDVHITDEYIYLLDYARGRVVQMSDMSGSGITFFEGEDAMSLYQPSSILTDSYGRIYIADTGNHRIVRIDDITGRGFIALEAESGEPRLFSFPQGLAIDGYGRIYIADSGNRKVVRVEDMRGANWREWDADGDMVYPTDIAISTSHIYVSDPSANIIFRTTNVVSGTTERMITGVESPLSIETVGEDILYWGGEMGIYRGQWLSADHIYWQPTVPCQGVTGIQVFE
mgnify:CR=1 FL=1